MRLDLPSPTQLVNRAAYHLSFRLGRLAARFRPPPEADWSLELANTYRLEAHLALTLARLGTLCAPEPFLRDLADRLDARSYLSVLARARPRVGSRTIRLAEAMALPSTEGDSLLASDDYYNPGSEGSPTWPYPYPMHPWVYALGWHRRVVQLRQEARRVRLFFAGVVHGGYAERFDFPILPRPAIVDCVAETFRADACIVTNQAEARQARGTDRPIVLILFRGDVTPMASNHFVGRAAYLRTLARSEFALCPPGVFMPHSHNLVEAMAVGTVPVLNYPEFCRPRLVDGESCLAFRTTDDLIATVRRVLTIEPTTIAPIRRAVVNHYDRVLSPEGAARRLAEALAQPGPNLRLALNREFETARAWSRSRASATHLPTEDGPQ